MDKDTVIREKNDRLKSMIDGSNNFSEFRKVLATNNISFHINEKSEIQIDVDSSSISDKLVSDITNSLKNSKIIGSIVHRISLTGDRLIDEYREVDRSGENLEAFLNGLNVKYDGTAKIIAEYMYEKLDQDEIFRFLSEVKNAGSLKKEIVTPNNSHYATGKSDMSVLVFKNLYGAVEKNLKLGSMTPVYNPELQNFVYKHFVNKTTGTYTQWFDRKMLDSVSYEILIASDDRLSIVNKLISNNNRNQNSDSDVRILNEYIRSFNLDERISMLEMIYMVNDFSKNEIKDSKIHNIIKKFPELSLENILQSPEMNKELFYKILSKFSDEDEISNVGDGFHENWNSLCDLFEHVKLLSENSSGDIRIIGCEKIGMILSYITPPQAMNRELYELLTNITPESSKAEKKHVIDEIVKSTNAAVKKSMTDMGIHYEFNPHEIQNEYSNLTKSIMNLSKGKNASCDLPAS